MLISDELLEKRLEELEAKVKEFARWDGDEDRRVRAARWMLAEVRAAVVEAREQYVGTEAARRLTGWSEATLRERAQKALNGEKMPHDWPGLRVKRTERGFGFLVSSIPAKPRAVA